MLIAAIAFSCTSAVLAKDSSGSTDISDESVDSIEIKNADGTDNSGTVYNWDDFLAIVSFSEDDSDGNKII
jgi:hypothetical protein